MFSDVLWYKAILASVLVWSFHLSTSIVLMFLFAFVQSVGRSRHPDWSQLSKSLRQTTLISETVLLQFFDNLLVLSHDSSRYLTASYSWNLFIILVFQLHCIKPACIWQTVSVFFLPVFYFACAVVGTVDGLAILRSALLGYFVPGPCGWYNWDQISSPVLQCSSEDQTSSSIIFNLGAW